MDNEKSSSNYNMNSKIPLNLEKALFHLDAFTNIPNSSGQVFLDDRKNESSKGMFEHLVRRFGFQKGNQLNQKEHLVFLIANSRSRKLAYSPSQTAPNEEELEKLIQLELHRKTFKNYIQWCQFLKIQPVFPGGSDSKYFHIALYFLIWGEAANLRFMPECICFLYYRLAIRYNNSQSTEVPEGWFLNMIVRPIYAQILAMNTVSKQYPEKKIVKDHKNTRNYDDINEFFWTSKSLDFDEVNVAIAMSKHPTKTFREKRSLFNPFLAFFRIYFFLFVMLHLLIVIAFIAYRGNPSSRSGLKYYENFFLEETAEIRNHSFYSIFLTISFFSVVKVLLELWNDGGLIFHGGKKYAIGLMLRSVWHLLFLGFSLCVTISPYEILFGSNTYLSMAPIGYGIYALPLCLAAFVRVFFFKRLRDSTIGEYVIRGASWHYIGRDCQQPLRLYSRYTLFWILVLGAKFTFNLQLMIVPLIGPSVDLFNLVIPSDIQVEGLMETQHNIGFLFALWLPVFLVYMYDTQIWFIILQAVVGMIIGLKLKIASSHRVKEFMDALRKAPFRFDQTVSTQLARSLTSTEDERQFDAVQQIQLRFAVVWNECISSFRMSDLIDDREATILRYHISSNGKVFEPVFLEAGKFLQAIDLLEKEAKHTKKWTTSTLIHRLEKDSLSTVFSSVVELSLLVIEKLFGQDDRAVIDALKHFLVPELAINFDFSLLGEIRENLIELIVSLLELPDPQQEYSNSQYHSDDAIAHVITRADNLMRSLEMGLKDKSLTEKVRNCLFCHMSSNMLYQKDQIKSYYEDVTLMNQTTRLFLLLTLDVADALPRCQEAQRRISFFLNSLNMKMPSVPSMSGAYSFSVLTPYYNETVIFSLDELHSVVDSSPLFKAVEEKGRNLTILKYLVTCHPEEWGNFLERIGANSMDEALLDSPIDVRLWASYRGQTLARTVQGIMMYEDAIKMLHWLEIGSDPEIDHQTKVQRMEQLVQMKFNYVTSAQMYSTHARQGDSRSKDINFLMKRYPNWRVAYADEISSNSSSNLLQTKYEAVLMKSQGEEIVEIFRYELPGNPIVGEGKPENQNIGLQFIRGEFVQTIDMNQEHYFEETLKMPNFLATADSQPNVSIIGMKEHIFTANASSLANFMTLQELVFVSLTQRVLANPLQSRMHYGHPDVFDKIFVMTNGGVSKASKGVNLSEDVFSGFNATLRGTRILHQEFMICGKGRDVTLSQITQFEAKLANGNGESSLSRESHRMGTNLDFFRLSSVYYGHMGFYIANWLTVFCVFVYAYAKIYIALQPQVEYLAVQKTSSLDHLAHVMNTQFIFQFGLLMTIPLVATMIIEYGFRTAMIRFLELIVTMGPVFYMFETGTKAHYFDIAILRGGSKYRGTGRGFHITRELFVNLFKEYAASHFRKAIELVGLMIIFGMYGNFSIGKGELEEFCLNNNDCESGEIPPNLVKLGLYSAKGQSYGVASFAVWLLAISWIISPFLFNTDGLDFAKSKADIFHWFSWMFQSSRNTNNLSGPIDNWQSWWVDEADLNKQLRPCGRIAIFVREARHLFILYYIFMFNFQLGDFFYVAGAVGSILTVLYVGGHLGRILRLSSLLNILFFLIFFVSTVGGIVAIGLLKNWGILEICSIIISTLSGCYGILQYLTACNGIIGLDISRWILVQQLAFLFDLLFGLVIVIPLFIMSAIPFISILQRRMIYNKGFSRALSTGGEYAASVSVLLGMLGGFTYGFLICLVFSLGYVNDKVDGFQNSSFTYYLDKFLDGSLSHDKEQIAVYAAGSSALGVFFSGLFLRFLGRRAGILLGSLVILGGGGLLWVENYTIILLGSIIISAGLAMIATSIVVYNYEICTKEWKGKGVLVLVFAIFVGYLVEASLMYSLNKTSISQNWVNEPKNDWRLHFIYGSIPLVILVALIFWLPESPVWLYRYGDHKACQLVLIRLRRKHDILEYWQDMEKAESWKSSGFVASILPRLMLVLLLQAAFALATTSTLFLRVTVKTSESAPGVVASRWQVYFGIFFMSGTLVAMFTVDQIRRKTVLKDILPFVAALALAAGLMDLSESSDSIIRPLLFVMFFSIAISLGAVTWLSAIELFPGKNQDLYTPLSYAFYYIIQAVVYQVTPGFMVSHLVFSGLCFLVAFLLFAIFASTKDGAIRLKKEKKLERENSSSDELQDEYQRISERNSRTNMRFRGAATSRNSSQVHYDILSTPNQSL